MNVTTSEHIGTPASVGLVEAARSLAGLVERDAPRAEAEGAITAETLDGLHSAGLFRLQVPAELGGAEADLLTALEVVEEVCRADGSAGWVLMAGMANMAIAGAFFGDEAVARIFADPRSVIAGQVAPRGVAVAEPAGYQVEGTFGFASGSSHADWFFGGFREVADDGSPVRLETGLPSVVVGVFPRAGVDLLGNWDVIGLVATASVDYRIPSQSVGLPYTFEFFRAHPLRGGPLYRIGANGLTCVAHSGFALGVARRALDEIGLLARSKRRPGRTTLIDDPLFQYQYAQAEAAVASARSFVRSSLLELEQAALADELTLAVRAQARLATSHACTTAGHVVTVAYRHSGSTGLKQGSVINRCYRDIAAGEQHVFTDHNSVRDAGLVYLDHAPPSMWL
jgi:alkylation response protein AidB-like acyl-CoA dehydrogenase